MHAADIAGLRQMLRFVAVFDEQEKWREDFCRSMADWLVARLSISYRTAAEWVRVARALRGLPAIDEVVSEGRLSWDQLAPLTEAATETTDQVLSGAAPGWSAAETKTSPGGPRPRRSPTPTRPTGHDGSPGGTTPTCSIYAGRSRPRPVSR